MKVEYLREGAEECPLIRIFAGSKEDYITLYNAIGQLANGLAELILLKSLKGFDAQSNCNIALKVSKTDHGVSILGDNNNFEWLLSKNSWSIVCDFILPFVNENNDLNSFQWLSGKNAYFPLLNGKISILISINGDW